MARKKKEAPPQTQQPFRALIIAPSGDYRVQTLNTWDEMALAIDPQCDEYGKPHVTVECISLGLGLSFFCDEEARLHARRPRANWLATALADGLLGCWGSKLTWDHALLGVVVFCADVPTPDDVLLGSIPDWLHGMCQAVKRHLLQRST